MNYKEIEMEWMKEILRDKEEEIKKLKEELDKFSEAYKKYRDYEKEELAESCYDFARENKELKEKIQTLELWLDNKEKLNEEYRKQLDKLRTDNIYEEWLYD